MVLLKCHNYNVCLAAVHVTFNFDKGQILRNHNSLRTVAYNRRSTVLPFYGPSLKSLLNPDLSVISPAGKLCLLHYTFSRKCERRWTHI